MAPLLDHPRALQTLQTLVSFLGARARRIGLVTIVLFGVFQCITYLSLSSSRTLIETPSSSSHESVKQAVVDSGRVMGRIAAGRVLVTGGGGNIGKYLVRRLLAASTPVTVLDTIFYSDELDLSSLPPSSRSLLRVHVGDIRNATVLDAAFTSDIVGVVHLAAVSRVLWCLENENDCWDVNEHGTQMVLDGLTQLNKSDKRKRWFVLASSREVYGDAPDNQLLSEDAPKNPSNIYGASKLAAEQVIESHLHKYDPSSGSLYAIALRLSNVYGSVYDHIERLVPSIATQALSHQIIQISGGQQHFDLVHIDDVVDAFLLAIQHLTQSLQTRSPFSLHTSFDAFNVASGDSVPVKVLINTLVGLTRSKSPIQYIPGDDRFPNVYRASLAKSESVLGYRAAISVETGLFRLVTAYLQRTEAFLSTRIDDTCSKASPLRTANTQLDKLNDCTVHIEADVQGQFVSLLAPNQDEGRSAWSTTNQLFATALRTYTSRPSGGDKLLLRVKDGVAQHSLGVADARPGPASIAQFTDEDIRSREGIIVDWEVEVNVDDSAVRLVVPGTDLQLMSPTAVGGSFSLVSKGKMDVWPFRITPMCCPAPSPWPFLHDDPLEFSIQYQRTELEHPFLSSPSKTLCHRLNQARSKVVRDLATISTTTTSKEPRRKLSLLPTDWANANLPACTNICNSPTICIDTGDCQCVLSSCVPHHRFLFSSYANLPTLSFPPSPISNVTSLLEVVGRSSWRNVLRPHASRLIGTNQPLLKMAISPLHPQRQASFNAADITKLKPQHCFTADSELERAIRTMDVGVREAEMVFVPHYQARLDGDIEETYGHAVQNVEGFDASKVVIPFTSDWGMCMNFAWTVWDMREKQGMKISSLVRSTTPWSVMGDLNSFCYRPHQDVIIPPRTCLSPKLLEAFSDIANVRPVRERRILAAFSGTVWGTGALDRQRLMCYRDGWRARQGVSDTGKKLHPDGPPLRVVWGNNAEYDYMGILNDTVFCPQPAGTTGWATRMADSVYAGCIPLLIGQAAQYPFFDMIDWSKISIRVDPSDLSHLEDVLLERHTLADIERLQANLLLVRNAFVYPLDDASEEEVREKMINERGPLFFALHSTRMRMLTKWPMNEYVFS